MYVHRRQIICLLYGSAAIMAENAQEHAAKGKLSQNTVLTHRDLAQQLHQSAQDIASISAAISTLTKQC